MRLAGRLCGRLSRSVGLAPSPPPKQQIRRTEEAGSTVDAAGNTIRLRRTTIEEIEISPPQRPADR